MAKKKQNTLLIVILCLIPVGVIAAIILACIIGFAVSSASTSNEPCDWCGSTPTKRYEVSQGYSYVCKECRSECAFCGKPAKKHYESGFGAVIFVCNDCYAEIHGN